MKCSKRCKMQPCGQFMLLWSNNSITIISIVSFSSGQFSVPARNGYWQDSTRIEKYYVEYLIAINTLNLVSILQVATFLAVYLVTFVTNKSPNHLNKHNNKQKKARGKTAKLVGDSCGAIYWIEDDRSELNSNYFTFLTGSSLCKNAICTSNLKIPSL